MELKKRKQAWATAITAADRHMRKCKRCYKKIPMAREMGIDPYRHGGFCPEARRLHDAEVAAMRAYREAGGVLPAL